MSTSSFTVLEMTDLQIVDALESVARQFEARKWTMDLRATCVGANHQWKVGAREGIAAILSHGGSLIDTAVLVVTAQPAQAGQPPSSCKLVWSREKSTVEVAHGSTSSLEMWAAARDAFAPVANAAVLERVATESGKRAEHRSEVLLAQLQDVLTEGAKRFADLGARTAVEHKERHEALLAEHKERQRGVEEDFEKRRAALLETVAAREKAVEEREASIRNAEPRDARRKLREDLQQAIKQTAQEFKLTPATETKRNVVHGVAGVTMAGFMAAAVGSAFTQDIPLAWSLRVGGMLGFAAVAAFWLRFATQWATRHADEEFYRKRLALDVDRANWVVEAALEWSREREEVMPESLLLGVSRGLFGDSEDHKSERPSDQLAELLRQSHRLKMTAGDAELELTRGDLAKADNATRPRARRGS